jgi:hypothetical protein
MRAGGCGSLYTLFFTGVGRSGATALDGRNAALARDLRSSSVVVRREDVRTFVSPVCCPRFEAWVREELTEGTKPLAMCAMETLGAFMPFSCRRCGGRPSERQPGGLIGAAAIADQTVQQRWRKRVGKIRFCALQLRPGVRENLAWMTLAERARRLECEECAVLAAAEQLGTRGGSGAGGPEEAMGPSPWLHIDFHTGAHGSGSTTPKEQAQPRSAADRSNLSEWIEARYMGSDEFLQRWLEASIGGGGGGRVVWINVENRVQ